MDVPEGSPALRIGELSRRLGVSEPVLRAWERRYGQLRSIAQEHLASNLICGRLAGPARGWGDGHGPRAVLAGDSVTAAPAIGPTR